jgi:hypothetical protein
MTGSFPSACEPHHEPFLPINPMHSLLVHDPALTSEQDMKAEITKTRTDLGEFA